MLAAITERSYYYDDDERDSVTRFVLTTSCSQGTHLRRLCQRLDTDDRRSLCLGGK